MRSREDAHDALVPALAEWDAARDALRELRRRAPHKRPPAAVTFAEERVHAAMLAIETLVMKGPPPRHDLRGVIATPPPTDYHAHAVPGSPPDVAGEDAVGVCAVCSLVVVTHRDGNGRWSWRRMRRRHRAARSVLVRALERAPHVIRPDLPIAG